MDLANFILRSAVAAVFVVAAVGKATNLSTFRSTLDAIGMPRRLWTGATWALIAAETTAAVLLIWGPASAAIALCFGLLVLFVVSSVIGLTKREDVNCACFGANDTVLGLPTIARSTFISVALVLNVFTSNPSRPDWRPVDLQELLLALMLVFALLQLSRWALSAPTILGLVHARREDPAEARVVEKARIREVEE
jgi:uncharacterized membrane protein YphA (DoxX/SURF4 family)